MNVDRPLILVSWISLVWSLLSVKLGARLARWCGFDGLQAAPTRGIPLKKTLDYLRGVQTISPIYLYEDVWCSEPRRWKTLDRLIFESYCAAAERYDALTSLQVQQIEHAFVNGGGSLVETSVGTWLTPQQMAETARTLKCNIAWDTYHVRRTYYFDGQLEEKPTGVDADELLAAWADWRSYLPVLAPYISVVHVQPMRGTDELSRWLSGQTTELDEMLTTLRVECGKSNKPPEMYVVELPPPDGTLQKLLWLIHLPRVMKDACRELKIVTAPN